MSAEDSTAKDEMEKPEPLAALDETSNQSATETSSDETKEESHRKKHKNTFKIPSEIKSLVKSLPDVKKYIQDLGNTTISQEKSIKRLKRKLKKKYSKDTRRDRRHGEKRDVQSKTEVICETSEASRVEVKTEPVAEQSEALKPDDGQPVAEGGELPGWGLGEGVSLADQVREAAESVLQESGFEYQESLGLYYDRGTGYYYDQNTGLYYDGINKTYYTYDEENHLFHVYHQIDTSAKDAEEQEIANWERALKKRKKELLRTKQRKFKKPRRKQEDSEEEEGECSDSSDSESQATSQPALDLGSERLVPAEEEVAPCMRLMVLETELKGLRVGTLFLVTCTGGTLGREGDHAVCIPDINVSKHHARFTFDKGQYLVCDLGSRNGTYLDGSRLSVALQESDPRPVLHGSELRLGGTRLTCHVHPGNETCGHCEPGLVQQEECRGGVAGGVAKEALHKEELLRLRRRFALTGLPEPDVVAAAEKAGYQDRAGKRRQTVGSLHHGAKTESASLEQSVPESNKGFKLLAKMGWKSGQSLGKDGTGVTEPIPVRVRAAKSGLGADEGPAPVQLRVAEKRRQAAWSKARDRFQQLPEATPDPLE